MMKEVCRQPAPLLCLVAIHAMLVVLLVQEVVKLRTFSMVVYVDSVQMF